jgi:sigma-B regulation protein RsbU (phosphoserine phosphatase)
MTDYAMQTVLQVDQLNSRAWKIFSSNPQLALELAQQGLELALPAGYETGIAAAWQNCAAAQWLLSDFVAALTSAREALQLYQKLGERVGEFNILSILSAIYGDLSEYENALDCQLKALRLAEELEDKPSLSQAYSNLGEIYYLSSQYQTALDYKLKALALDEASGEQTHLASTLSSIGDISLKLNHTQAALDYQLKALAAIQQVSNPYELAYVYYRLGIIYLKIKQYEQARPYLYLALELFEGLANKVGMTTVLIQLVELYSNLGLGKSALDSYQRALELGQETQARDLSYQIHAAVSKFYETKGNFAKALEHYKRFAEIKSEVFSQENQKALANLQIRFDMEKAEKEREIFRLRNVELAAANQEIAALNERLKNEIRVVRRELEIGRKIQADFLPEILPQAAGWELDHRFQPAGEVSGDFYDAFTLPGQRLGLVIADVCDKGVGAALFMSLVRSLVRVLAQQTSFRLAYHLGDSFDMAGLVELPGSLPGQKATYVPADMLEYLNTISLVNTYITTNHRRSDMFATLFFGVLDTKTGLLCYVNAGHDAPLCLGSSGLKQRLTLTGPAVGAIDNLVYKMGYLWLDPGETLLAYTDGVTEALNSNGDVFTEQRLLALVEQWQAEGPLEAGELLDRISTAIQHHVGSAEASDDITMLAVRRYR